MLARRNVYASARAMMIAHYHMPRHVATMRILAEKVYGVPNHSIANRVYGSFASRVRRELGVTQPKYEIWILGTWPETPIDDVGEFAFRLRPEVCKALERLGWV